MGSVWHTAFIWNYVIRPAQCLSHKLDLACTLSLLLYRFCHLNCYSQRSKYSFTHFQKFSVLQLKIRWLMKRFMKCWENFKRGFWNKTVRKFWYKSCSWNNRISSSSVDWELLRAQEIWQSNLLKNRPTVKKVGPCLKWQSCEIKGVTQQAVTLVYTSYFSPIHDHENFLPYGILV